MEPEIGSVPTGFLSNSLILQNFVKSLPLISLIRNLKEEGGGGGGEVGRGDRSQRHVKFYIL